MTVQTSARAVPDAALAQFEREVTAAVERSVSGPELVNTAVDVFRSHLGAAEDRVHAFQASVRDAHRQLTQRDAMLGQMGATVGREVQVAVRLAAQVAPLQEMAERVATVADRVRREHPELARELADALSVPQLPEDAPPPVVAAFVPDNRWSSGVFVRAGSEPGSPLFTLPFAGWVLTATPALPPAGGLRQRPEMAFILHGRARGCSQLESHFHLVLQEYS